MAATRFLLVILCIILFGSCAPMGSWMGFAASPSIAIAQSASAAGSESSSNVTAKQPPKRRTVKPTSTNDKRLDTPSAMYPVTPNVGSPEWVKEKAENERQERRLKEVIEGICRGC